jgi:hypothetical protein
VSKPRHLSAHDTPTKPCTKIKNKRISWLRRRGELGASTVNAAPEFGKEGLRLVVELESTFEPERLIGGKMK